MIEKLDKNFVYCIFGKPATGKTTLLKDFLIDHYNDYYTIFLLDPSYNFEHFYSFKKIINLTPGDENVKNEYDIRFLNYKSFDDTKEHRKLLIIDEAHRYLGLNNRNRINILFTFIRQFRHINLDILIATHRPQDLDKIIIENSDKIISFRLDEKNTLNYLKNYFSDIEQLKNLKNYHYLVKSQGDENINIFETENKPQEILKETKGKPIDKSKYFKYKTEEEEQKEEEIKKEVEKISYSEDEYEIVLNNVKVFLENLGFEIDIEIEYLINDFLPIFVRIIGIKRARYITFILKRYKGIYRSIKQGVNKIIKLFGGEK